MLNKIAIIGSFLLFFLVRNFLQQFVNERNEHSGQKKNVAEIIFNHGGDVSGIIIQTEGMRKFYSSFPEVVLVDTTYCTNSNRYKLFSFMITDAFGMGQFVQHAYIDSETIQVMTEVLRIFRDNNPASEKTSVFVVSLIWFEKRIEKRI
jgi:hypothetical protein